MVIIPARLLLIKTNKISILEPNHRRLDVNLIIMTFTIQYNLMFSCGSVLGIDGHFLKTIAHKNNSWIN